MATRYWIVSGPRRWRFMLAFLRSRLVLNHYLNFVLVGIDPEFGKGIKITEISWVSDALDFKGVWEDAPRAKYRGVTGHYNPKTRKGWLEL